MQELISEIKLAGMRGAAFSPCGKYRYALWRTWDFSKHRIMFIGLNPSTANAVNDDPTIRRVAAMAKEWGYGGVIMANLFAYITPLPRELKKQENAVGHFSTEWLQHLSKFCSKPIFAWGNFPQAKERAQEVIEMFPDALCLAINKTGMPKHPLYVETKVQPIRYMQPGRVYKTTRHMQVSIASMLNNYKGKSMVGLIDDENGVSMSDSQARLFLANAQAKGWKLLPTGGCDGFDHFGKGCPGHSTEKK